MCGILVKSQMCEQEQNRPHYAVGAAESCIVMTMGDAPSGLNKYTDIPIAVDPGTDVHLPEFREAHGHNGTPAWNQAA